MPFFRILGQKEEDTPWGFKSNQGLSQRAWSEACGVQRP